MIRLAAARMFGARRLAGWMLGGRGLAVHEVDAGKLADRALGTGDLAARGLAARVAARVAARLAARLAFVGMVRVLVARQEPEPGLEGRDTGQLEVGSLGENLDLVDGQGDAEFTAPGVEAGEAAVADPGH